MALPRRWERGDGSCAAVTPRENHLRAVRVGAITWAAYRATLDRSLAWAAEINRLAPGQLSYVSRAELEADGRARARPVPESASLLCACAAPGPKRRNHPCHLEIVAPYLVVAGWDVRLWDRWLVAGPTGVTDATTGETYDPASYGWTT